MARPQLWLMDGTNATFVGAVGPFNPGPSWHVKGVGDFDGDGKSDIIWQHDNGTAAMWLMDGTTPRSSARSARSTRVPSWHIKGTGDFNGDGKSDILWQHDNGTAAMWLMDGTDATFVGAAGRPTRGQLAHQGHRRLQRRRQVATSSGRATTARPRCG